MVAAKPARAAKTPVTPISSVRNAARYWTAPCTGTAEPGPNPKIVSILRTTSNPFPGTEGRYLGIHWFRLIDPHRLT